MKIKVRGFKNGYKAFIIKNAFEIVDYLDRLLEIKRSDYTFSIDKEWVNFERDTILGLIDIINKES